MNVKLTEEISSLYRMFQSFYKIRHRKLSWVHILGDVTVTATFNNVTCEFIVSTLEAVLLLAFNSNSPNNSGHCDDKRNKSDLLSVTGIEMKELNRLLTTFTEKFNVLKRLTRQSLDESHLLVDDSCGDEIFQVNKSFFSSNQVIHFPSLIASNCHGRLEKLNRNLILETAIIRVMKSCKELNFNLVMEKLCPQLQVGLFTPSNDEVKIVLESLVHRGYLSKTSPHRYKYPY